MNQIAYRLVDVDQQTEAWRMWRCAGISSSDASVIIGQSKFKSAGELQQEKLLLLTSESRSAEAQEGLDLEGMARTYYEDRMRVQTAPVCVESIANPWMRASVDGLHMNGQGVVEIKCGDRCHKTVSTTRYVPEYYYPQIQHILAVLGFEEMDFWCYRPGKRPVLIRCPRNERYIERLIETEFEFWRFIEADVLTRIAERKTEP
jgi:putative phage-type endonuclease